MNLQSLIRGEHDENELREDFRPSERVAILEALLQPHGGARVGDQVQNFALGHSEAARKAGFGNYETARQAKSVTTHGAPELVAAMIKSKILLLIVIAPLAKPALVTPCSAAISDAVSLERTFCPAENWLAVLTLLRDEEWAKWSDNQIAKKALVSQPFVSSLRSSLISVISDSEPRTYTTKHGTTATVSFAHLAEESTQGQCVLSDKIISKAAQQPALIFRLTRDCSRSPRKIFTCQCDTLSRKGRFMA